SECESGWLGESGSGEGDVADREFWGAHRIVLTRLTSAFADRTVRMSCLNRAPSRRHTQRVSSTVRNTSLQNDNSSTSVVRRLAAVLDAFRARDVYLGVNEIAR